MAKKTVSVVIPTYNEARYIKGCLTSLLAQRKDLLEIIVVDDGSTDETIALIQELATKYPIIRLLKQKHLGPGAARNKGAKVAQGTILVFVDADMEFEHSFIQHLVKPISQTTIGTFSKHEYVANNKNSWAQAWSILRGFESGRMHPADYPETQKVFRAVLRSKFIEAGGFDLSRGYDDDWSLSEKLEVEAVSAANAIFYHYNPDSPQEIFMQARWSAKRDYKFGVWGKIVGLFRASWPVSLLNAGGLYVRYRKAQVFVARLIYDVAISVGILEMLLTGKKAK
jgi:glycosyltransferase involved in cell wall biosynthesis